MSNPSENTPLLPSSSTSPRSQRRNVTFSDDPVTRTISPDAAPAPSHLHAPGAAAGAGAGHPPALSAFNSKLRRRNSHGAAPTTGTLAGPKLGPQRSTKKTEKLKLLPAPEQLDDDDDDVEGVAGAAGARDVYSQLPRIKDPSARRDAARLGKADRDRLPRVTAYCTANRYDMDALLRFLKGRGRTRNASPKLIDECIYTPYRYSKHATQPQPQRPALRPDPVQTYERRHSTGGDSVDEDTVRDNIMASAEAQQQQQQQHDGALVSSPPPLSGEQLLGPSVVMDGGSSDGNGGVVSGGGDSAIADDIPDFDITVHTPEVFLFDYGVVVLWGMTEAQETRFLKEIARFELEKLSPDDVETEHFNFYYTQEYQARIYNDFITLRDKNNYMIKLSISHALAQSVKVRSPLGWNHHSLCCG